VFAYQRGLRLVARLGWISGASADSNPVILAVQGPVMGCGSTECGYSIVRHNQYSQPHSADFSTAIAAAASCRLLFALPTMRKK
jgi:hypothetical protein